MLHFDLTTVHDLSENRPPLFRIHAPTGGTGMSIIFDINRDFPFQVAMTFDEIAMDMLDWLDSAAFQWDMYVDLPDNTVRYCFRRLVDASAFKRQFGQEMERRAAAG
jgi:hypothetical protein